MSKKNKKSKNKVVKQDTGAQTISRLLTVAILAGIGFSVYQDVYANESRYMTDEELLEPSGVGVDSEALEDHEKSLESFIKALEDAEKGKETKEILVCWSESQQRLVPVYMGCK